MSKWLPGSTSHQANFDGITLHYETMGDPAHPPVILLHGFPEFWYNWRHQMPALAEAGYYVIAPDQRGYNHSSKEGPFTMERLALDIAHFQDALGISRCAIVGHDWGGVVSWYFSARYPERVTCLTTMNGPHPRAYQDACLRAPRQLLMSWYIFFFQLPWLPELAIRANDFKSMRTMFAQLPKEYMSDVDIDRYIEMLRQPGGLRAMIGWYRALPRQLLNSRRTLPDPTVRVPSCVIWGAADHALHVACTETLATYVPDLEVHLLPESTHWVQLDNPPAVNALLLDFLRRRG